MPGQTTDLLFPPRVLPELSEARGKAWRDLVATVKKVGPNSPEETAFVLLMARLNNCAACNADSFRSAHGCETCSKQSLKHFRGSDEELGNLFEDAMLEVKRFFHRP